MTKWDKQAMAATGEAFDAIDRVTEPKAMSKEKAIDVLERIMDGCESRIECLREELKTANQD